jgi:hypothetical protein
MQRQAGSCDGDRADRPQALIVCDTDGGQALASNEAGLSTVASAPRAKHAPALAAPGASLRGIAIAPAAGLCRMKPSVSTLPLRTSTGSLVDGVDTAALLLAAGVNLANGGADRPVGGARVLHRRGRGVAVAASVGVTPGVPDQH